MFDFYLVVSVLCFKMCTMRFRHKLVVPQFSQLSTWQLIFLIVFYWILFTAELSFWFLVIFFILLFVPTEIFCAIENPMKSTKYITMFPFFIFFHNFVNSIFFSSDFHFRAKPKKTFQSNFACFFLHPPPGTAFTLSINFPCHHEFVLHTKKSFAKSFR